MSRTLIIGGGGSAGHVLPSLRISEHLKDKNWNIYYVGGKNSIEETLCKKHGVRFFSIKTAKFDRTHKLTLPLSAFFNLIGIIQSFFLFLKLKPNAVFVTGGFASLPVVVGARIIGVKIIDIHVCDLSLGLAHKLSIPFATHITCTFSRTAEKFKKGKYVGPIASYIKKSSIELNSDRSRQKLLVYGGSLGAKAINQKVRSSINELLIDYDIIHICGAGNLSLDLISLNGYSQFEFVHDFSSVLSEVDIAICRGGANSLWELILAGIPHLAIPLPLSVSRGDQIENCEYFASLGITVFLEQEEFITSDISLKLKQISASSYEIKNNMIKIIPKELAQTVIEDILEGEEIV